MHSEMSEKNKETGLPNTSLNSTVTGRCSESLMLICSGMLLQRTTLYKDVSLLYPKKDSQDSHLPLSLSQCLCRQWLFSTHQLTTEDEVVSSPELLVQSLAPDSFNKLGSTPSLSRPAEHPRNYQKIGDDKKMKEKKRRRKKKRKEKKKEEKKKKCIQCDHIRRGKMGFTSSPFVGS